MMGGSANYKAAGVDYDALDEGKRQAMARALATSSLLTARGGRALDASRGEPAFVFDFNDRTLAFVMEGLGTKSVIARHMLDRHGVNRFADVAYDTVAAILNDLCCVGALPLVVNAYFATGASEWYAQPGRATALLEGWQRGCVEAGCVWGGGESPSLSGLVAEEDVELAGAAVGALPAGCSAILGQQLRAGDEIVLIASSGLHANGASLARMLVARLPEGYMTTLPSGRTLGEALLDPSKLYVPLVQALLESELRVSYLSHVTGHGLMKLMRPSKALTYRVSELPPVPEALAFLVAQSGLDSHSAYSTFNMGCGYAVYCEAGAGAEVAVIARELGFEAIVAGSVEAGPRRVILEPVDVLYGGGELEFSPATDPT
jgi:phosphoribosylformylglycinamidine cyclo-ligase